MLTCTYTYEAMLSASSFRGLVLCVNYESKAVREDKLSVPKYLDV